MGTKGKKAKKGIPKSPGGRASGWVNHMKRTRKLHKSLSKKR